MSEAADPTTLGWPPPPLAVARLKLRQRIVGPIAVVFFVVLILVLLIGVFGYTGKGRALLVDSGLALGLGAPLEGAAVEVRECDPYQTTGRYGSSGVDCDIVVRHAGPGGAPVESVVEIDIRHAEHAGRAGRAGMLLGAVGLYWPVGVLVERWLQTWMLFFAVGVLAAMLWLILPMLRRDRALRRAGRAGVILAADLLFLQEGYWHYAYRDARGRRRWGRALVPGAALVLDPVLTCGAALRLSRKRAQLIMGNLHPLVLAEDAAERVRLAARHRHETGRSPLPPLDGEPTEPGAAFAAIEALAAAGAGKDDLARAYLLAWRHVWNCFDDAGVRRAFELRNRIGARLGAAAAAAVIEECRRRFAPSGD